MLIDEELRLKVVAVAGRGMSFDRHAHAALAFYETSQEPTSLLARQAFLLIVCTVQIFTHTATSLSEITLSGEYQTDTQISQHIARFCNSLAALDAVC